MKVKAFVRDDQIPQILRSKMCNIRVSVFALMATVRTDGSVMLSWTTVVSTLLLTLLHCCGSRRSRARQRRGVTGRFERRAAASYLKHAAGAALAQTGDAVQVVGGDGLILLLDEAEGWEVEAGLLTLAVLQHGGELIHGAPFNRRRTSQVPRLHMDTYRQRVNCRYVARCKQALPLDFQGAALQLGMLVIF